MPIIELQRRYRQLGRIRIGEKGEKGQPVKRDTFRLTSPAESLLIRAAELWGGTPAPWTDGPNPGEWELATTADALEVLVPQQDLASNQWYEMWSGGGIKRRCDGLVDMVSGKDCLCDPESRACQITTHLVVMLPQLPDIGVWRMTSHGFNAAAELPGTVELLDQVRRAGGMPGAVLAIERRSNKVEGRTNRFVVPVLRLPASLVELGIAASTGGLMGLSVPPVADVLPASPKPSLPPPPPLPDAEPFRIEEPPPIEYIHPKDGPAEIEHTLDILLDDPPDPSWTMPRIEEHLRALYDLMDRNGYWPTGPSGIDALHMALAKTAGVQHVGDLKKADLLRFCEVSWQKASEKVRGT